MRLHIPPVDPEESTIAPRALVRVLAEAWADMRHPPGGIQGELDGDSLTTTESILRAFDACLRSGAGSVVFRTPRGTPADRPAVDGGVGSRGPFLLASSHGGPDSPPPPPRAVGRSAGQTASPPLPIVETPPLGADAIVSPSSGPENPLLATRRNRAAILRAEGGEGTEAAVDDSLDWLRRHQHPGGYWDAGGFETQCRINKCGGAGQRKFTPGVTGLALLSFLGRGETHKTPRDGAVVRNALKYLKGIQDSEGTFGPRTGNDGEVPGLPGMEDDPLDLRPMAGNDRFVYNHAIAALAMAEAYGLTRSPLFKASAQNGVNFILQCRNPYLGWRYGVRPQDNDTSVTAWMVLALDAARSAGLEVDPAAFEGATAWLDRVTDRETGRTGYTARDNGPARPQELMDRFPAERSEATTAMAILTRLLSGARADDPLVRKGADLCLAKPPLWEPVGGAIDYVHWFFGSGAMFQVGGDRWTRWNAALGKAVLSRQRTDRADDRLGSWDPSDPWSSEGGRVYATAIQSLCLETCYRHPRRSAK